MTPDTSQDPFKLFAEWFAEAENHTSIKEANAVNLATSTIDGKPSSRMVLLKGYDQKGFVFYTNLESRKAGEILKNRTAAMCFYWEALSKQIRIEGSIEDVSKEEADTYFASRPLKSRIGAWASQQSRLLESQEKLLKEIAKQTTRFASGNVPRPEHWSGFRLVPDYFEFWQSGEFRIHQRHCFKKQADNGWETHLLYP